MASTICQVSQCLRRLTLGLTNTDAAIGSSFFSDLADSELATLEYSELTYSGYWFEENKECFD